ncbi:NACHT domain-containing protein [Oscillatoria sp. CS-180]|uniref:NACHT domain-containing protein n=1 Tax=Oscillatoria sp. CS-180 TaxID=3021720 RepID=UPI00232EC57A|nr:NACHT domain-containing protein [Oscillatoria sp. CS-180]MDB9528587.1 NACHT domain-containing protein [Oscillatoria sp. CS-180]
MPSTDQASEPTDAGQFGLPDNKPKSNRPDANERILVDAVWTEVVYRLRLSLHNAILIRLGMTEQCSQVSRPWDRELRIPDQGTRKLDANTSIADIFDRSDVGGKLLILGNPGSGKTTTMLDLAAVLIQRANDQPDHPIPVMFNVSSWQRANQSITDWLLSELKEKYGVSPKLGQTWLQTKTLLPLLDGLDELPATRQEPVVQAINDWLISGEGPSRLLVCSRREEYELYATKLALNGAVCLEPLTDSQLETYLRSLKAESLWTSLNGDAALLELVRTPLLLSVSILAKDGIDLKQWQRQQTTQARMSYLLDAYVEQRLHETIKSREYPPGQQPTARQTRHWLVWLAKQLQAQSEDEFLIEKMQPTMLATRSQRLFYGLIGGLILGLIFGLIGGLRTDITSRVTPNQGIIQAAKNIVPVSLLSYPGGILVNLGSQFANSVAENGFNPEAWTFDLQIAFLQGVAFAFLVGGGLAGWYSLVQHFALRVVLHRANAIPWDYARFLNHCTERLLQQRVGGRYRFIHRLVLEHFAAMK